MQINWRSTRLRTWLGVLIVIPNSVMARSAVANHTRLSRIHRCALLLQIDQSFAPARVQRVAAALHDAGIPLGALVTDVRFVAPGAA